MYEENIYEYNSDSENEDEIEYTIDDFLNQYNEILIDICNDLHIFSYNLTV